MAEASDSSWVSHMDDRAQGLVPRFSVFPGALAGSWMGTGASGIQSDTLLWDATITVHDLSCCHPCPTHICLSAWVLPTCRQHHLWVLRWSRSISTNIFSKFSRNLLSMLSIQWGTFKEFLENRHSREKYHMYRFQSFLSPNTQIFSFCFATDTF